MSQAVHSVRCSPYSCNRPVVGSLVPNVGMEWPPFSQTHYPSVPMDSACRVKGFLRTQCVIVVCLHTGNSAFLRRPPALFSACCIYGPTIGTFPANALIVEKKSPKSTNIPYNSTRKPIKGHRSSMSMTPVAKAAVPFNFWRRAKKTAVFWRPIIRVRPRTKRICSQND